MPVLTHHTDPVVAAQLPPLVGDSWTTEVVPQLPVARAAQARTLKAFQRKRGLQYPTDLLRGLLAYVLCACSGRQLGAWAVLIGLADLSETAWRKRLRLANGWLRQAYERQRWFWRGFRLRAGIEGRIRVLKRDFGLDRCRDHGDDGMGRWVGWGIVTANLAQIAATQVARQAKARERQAA